MRRFENLLYTFVGVGLGMLITASLYEKEIQKIYHIVEIPKTGDITDELADSEKGYYEHLYRTK
jgi:hypothetical protein